MTPDDPWTDLERRARGPLAAEEWQVWRALVPAAIRAALPPVGSPREAQALPPVGIPREARALGAGVSGLLAQHPEQAPRIVTWLREQPPYSRRFLEALLSGALAADPPLPVVAGLLDLFESRVRWPDVAAWLDRRRPEPGDWQPVLVRLREGSPTVRRAALQLLTLAPGDVAFAEEALVAALQDPEPGVVGRAALLLARRDPRPAGVAEALQRAASRTDLRAFAREALRAAAGPDA